MKKLFTLFALIFLATTCVFAFNIKSRVKVKKPLPKVKQAASKQPRPMPTPQTSELAKNIRESMPLSRLDYVMNLQLAVADSKNCDFESNVNLCLSKIDPKKAADKNIAFAITDYQKISDYFDKRFNKDPQQGTLEEYQALYAGLGNQSPMEYNMLPTFAIWQTGSVEAIFPFRHQIQDYWDNPLLAAKAYDVMARIDYEATRQMFTNYMRLPKGRSINCPENDQQVKAFFAAWRAQKDKTLPSVKDADVLEQITRKNSNK